MQSGPDISNCMETSLQPNMVKLQMANRFQNLTGKDVWEKLADMAIQNRALDLGQGYPNYLPPESPILAALRQVASQTYYEEAFYPWGYPPLVQALSKMYSRLWQRDFQADEEILVTAGAYEALICSILAFVNPGDEVIVIEPFFGCYEPIIRIAGGVPVHVTLKPDLEGKGSAESWRIDMDELNKAFNSKTRAFLLNTPHNPTGKVFGYEELKAIAQLCEAFDVLCISDEVYEWLTYAPAEHIRIASLPGMWERTVTICSAGKMFGVTGWRIGWAYGERSLLKSMKVAHANLMWSCPTPLQDAVARVLESEIETGFALLKQQSHELKEKRDTIVDVLTKAGLRPVIPQGGYFVLADWTENENMQKDVLKARTTNEESIDMSFVNWLSKKGVQAVPASIFYSPKNRNFGEPYVRFCFIKAVRHALNSFTSARQTSPTVVFYQPLWLTGINGKRTRSPVKTTKPLKKLGMFSRIFEELTNRFFGDRSC